MNYDNFRLAWQEALAGAVLRIWGFPDEAIVLPDMARTYRTYVSLGGMPPADAFNVTAELSWEWDALLSARSETTEEDMLMQILGDGRRNAPTESPWLRGGCRPTRHPALGQAAANAGNDCLEALGCGTGLSP